ncbi:glycerophosphodiester phosphodiesterase [Granulosicoccaceae sp. 1_MG-2023]|nr:glycerophosphodiester phosphodiesterase [Granulosicoccaceae sp. 1_MG-2023]
MSDSTPQTPAGVSTPVNPLKRGRPLLFAHRGSSLMTPENTFTAFDFGLDHQADVLEIDVRITRDNELVVFHDARVDRTTDGLGEVRGHALKALKHFDAGYRFSDARGACFRGRKIRIPTLSELYEAYPDVVVNIDIKDNWLPAARLLADTIERAGAEQRSVVASFHSRVLQYFRQIAPQIPTSATFHEVLGLYLSRDPLRKPVREHPVAVQIPPRHARIALDRPRFIEKIHARGKLVNYWTINDPALMKRLLEAGADGIVTDRPDLALQVFRESGLK